MPLGVGAFATTGLLSVRGKLRLLREPFVRRWKGEDESVAAFVDALEKGEPTPIPSVELMDVSKAVIEADRLLRSGNSLES